MNLNNFNIIFNYYHYFYYHHYIFLFCYNKFNFTKFICINQIIIIINLRRDVYKIK